MRDRTIEWKGYGIYHAWRQGSREAVCGVLPDKRDGRYPGLKSCPMCETALYGRKP